MNYKTSGFVAAIAFVVAMSFGPVLNAQITISVNNPTVGIGTNETVSLSATGTDPVAILTLVTVVDQNLPVATTPNISSISGVGGFSGATSNFPTSLPAIATNPSFTLGSPVVIDGTDFATIGFDTSGLSAGDTFDLDLSFNGINSFFNDNNADIEAIFPESFVITVVDTEAIPEPSALVLLLAGGGVAMLRRRKLA